MIFYTHECEEVLGYSFKNQELLRRCFTHASYANEHRNCQSNERLEFLGDSVLGFVVANYLFNKKSNDDEGKMTTEKQNIVSTKPLADATRRLKLERFLLITDGHKGALTDKICENLFECVVAGLYLDGGLEVAERFIKNNLLSLSSSKKAIVEAEVDCKSRLQMLLQKKYKNNFKLEYAELKREGPPHKPVFTMAVVLNGEILSKGRGNSKISAEQEAANNALNGIGDKQKGKKQKGETADGKNPKNAGTTAKTAQKQVKKKVKEDAKAEKKAGKQTKQNKQNSDVGFFQKNSNNAHSGQKRGKAFSHHIKNSNKEGK